MENTATTIKPEDTSVGVAYIKPFENIALAFSGGGFRAASFALGVLSYLNKVVFLDDEDQLKGKSLLEQVTYLSSASGGTITTALYALYNAQGKTFGEFYARLFNTLTGDELLKNALEILSDTERWKSRPDKGHNIINAFAIAYDEYIFEGNTLGSLYYSDLQKGHLQEVCFNTTEFYTGQSFRQAKKMANDPQPDPYFKFGNEVIFLNGNIADKLKLGDLLAASSCFPAGFEPIVFPNDYTTPDLKEETLKAALTMKEQNGDKQELEFIAKKRVGFMDGGITDNQGLQSMMYADGRRITQQTSFTPFDLMLVNDVGSHFISPYVMPEATKGKGISLSALNIIVIVCFTLSVGITVTGVVTYINMVNIVGAMLITLPLVFIAGVLWLRSQVNGIPGSSSPLNLKKSFTENIIKMLVRYFTRTSLNVLKQMLEARSESVLMLNMSIFLKRIRQLLYNTFYGSEQWKHRGKGNHIYDLSFSNNINRNHNVPNVPPPPAFLDPGFDMQIVAQAAFNMGTTLWFDKKAIHQQHSEACIIACGQFTTCYNLLEYICRLLDDPSAYDPIYKIRLESLKSQLLADYNAFKEHPFYMYNKYGIEYKIAGFKELAVNDIPFPKNWEHLKKKE